MEIEQFLGSLGERIGKYASVRNVFGDPIHSGDRTIIPVARVGYGFGGGIDREPTEDESGEMTRKGGGGGGLGATPAGALEITPEGTRFVEFGAMKKMTAALLIGVAAGLLIGQLGKR
ncbi:MAG: spore germination protein GerW family protein [Bryobacterales bacterium]